MDLEKVRQAAERVARSEGLEIADVEWKVGKQRFLRVYIDRLPERAAEPDANDGHEANGADGSRLLRKRRQAIPIQKLLTGIASGSASS